MKTFLKILGALLAVIILYALIAIMFFDGHYHGEKSIIINSPKENVWQHVNSMKVINEWNPWMKLDKNLVSSYQGKSGEIGDYYHWKGNDDVGEGEETITAIVPFEKITTSIHFIKPFEDHAVSNIILESQGSNTKVTWDMNFECKTMMKPMKPLMNMQMMKAFKEGLNDLKTISEK